MPRLAWFSPMPPVRSGVATVSAHLVPALRAWYDIDVFVDASTSKLRKTDVSQSAELRGDPHRHLRPRQNKKGYGGQAVSGMRVDPRQSASSGDVIRDDRGPVNRSAEIRDSPRPRSAHDFVWLNQQAPYDLTVYQLGNSSVHEYMWPYMFRYPGLTALHDVHVHHARAAALLRARRTDDYRVEFAANHTDVNPDLAELAAAGFDNHLYYHWPMTRLVAERSRLTAVHAEELATRLRLDAPRAAVESIRLGHGQLMDDGEGARKKVRARYAMPDDEVVFGCFGGLSPEKRLPQIVAAFSALQTRAPGMRLLLTGAIPAHYDLHADIERAGIAASTIMTGYLDTEEELNAHISACDVALNLRWPTAREISGPWLRCLAAGVPTVVTQLAHLSDVPSLDPRTWRSSTEVHDGSEDGGVAPVCIAIDILDEDHSLRLAMRRLARDAPMRSAVGEAGQAWWKARHTPAVMVEDYRRLIRLAVERPVPEVPLPPHLISDGSQTLHRVLEPFGLPDPLR